MKQIDSLTAPFFWIPLATVLLGFGLLHLFPQIRKGLLRLFLSFSGAFLLALTFYEFIPEIYQSSYDHKLLGLGIAIGMLSQLILEYFSKGAEHGHAHIHGKLGYFPLVLFISLSIHALLEGFPLQYHQHYIWGIVIHKIPIVLILGGFLIQSGMDKIHQWLFMIGFAMMTPLGGLLGNLGLLAEFQPYVMAIVVGILLHISTTILFESTDQHRFNAGKLLMIILGFALAFLF